MALPRWSPSRPVVAVLVAVVAGVLAPVSSASAVDEPPATYAPLANTPPALTVPAAQLAAALRCPPLKGATRTPVLLVPGTGVTPEQNFGWSWVPALARRGIPQCTLALPHQGLGDIQTAGEHVVFAIRTMSAAAGRRISIVGHSQGGMVPRWALRFWSDTRAMVDDVIALAPDNKGVPPGDTVASCRENGCPPATVQQVAGSRFLEALNSRLQAFGGVSYTNVRTRTDEILTPGDLPAEQASSSLTSPQGRITNVAIHEVCPNDGSGHRLIGTISNTAFELAMDALAHDGPADPARAKTAACAAGMIPAIDPSTLEARFRELGAMSDADRAAVPIVREEPALKTYVGGRFDVEPPPPPVLAPAPPAAPRLTVRPTRVRAGRLVRLRLRVTTGEGRPLSRQRVRVLGRSVRTDAHGRATLRVRPATAGRFTARSTGNGLPGASARIRVTRGR